MSRYLLLLPAPEAEWADLPPEEHEKGHRSHGQFHRDLAAGGHRLIVGSVQVCDLTPPILCVAMRKGQGIEPMIRDARTFSINIIDPKDKEVWDRLTVLTFPKARYRALGGEPNPDFLNPQVFLDEVLRPYHIDRHTLQASFSIGVAVFIALVLRAFVVEAFKIPSGSMIPTLEVGDHIFVNKFLYGIRIPWTNHKLFDQFRAPRRGEVVVFIYPQEPDKDFIKRIVAVAGDTVDLKNGQVIINGQPVPHEAQQGPCEYEDYTEETGEWNRGRCEAFKEVNGGIPYTVIHTARGPRGPGILSFPLTVPPRSVFVMGDNRDNSHDSRYWGFVPFDLIKGKAWIIWWSAGKGSSVRLDRMFKLIHP